MVLRAGFAFWLLQFLFIAFLLLLENVDTEIPQFNHVLDCDV